MLLQLNEIHKCLKYSLKYEKSITKETIIHMDFSIQPFLLTNNYILNYIYF